MQIPTDRLGSYLRNFDFRGLFVEGLGWDIPHGVKPTRISIEDHEYVLELVAEKAGFAVYVCSPNADGETPDNPVRRKIEWWITKRVFEHLIIFIDADKTAQIWQWVKREAGRLPACREHRYYTTQQTGKPLLQRLEEFYFTLEDECKGIGIKDVTAAVGKAFDVEKVTRRFYDRFKTELEAFRGFIDGIAAQGDREWYASLMLNRMMFVYFVQKQGFLDDDTDYLRNHLHMVQSKYGSGRFQQFYRDFLVKLFHEGLGQPEHERDPELHDLLGRVPFLNGGLFDVHDLERNHPKISIPDEAFESIFDFFDGYRWHLDERPRREDNEINPDVLGYIFEKYINQKQMGAYYTKDDITGYITRNTVIPFLFDAVKNECLVAFNPGGSVWRMLRGEPDRYIYAAVGHGLAWNYSPEADPQPLEKPLELPADIAAGLDNVSRRGDWNLPAPAEYALPTETWREVVARRRRYQEVRDRLAAGGVTEVNDLITLNLDIERFVRDVILQSEGPELLRAFWKAVTTVSILDPTCGSGAFLFATLNVLEPLYTACLEGMRGFVDDLERSKRPHGPNTLNDFRTVLEQVAKHPSQRYFILKYIVLNNLYGVDIMEEAVEICKLRLFLKLVAQLESYDQIEPLPDIDFNVRAGNTLVGFTTLDAVQKAMLVTDDGFSRFLTNKDQATLARINEAAEISGRVFDRFRNQQTDRGEVTQGDKTTLRSQRDALRDELDRYLAAKYKVDTKNADAYGYWRASHQPFHWFVEFYRIMNQGGFDVVVGNPPYVEYRKVKGDYTVRGYRTEPCGNLYAFVVERNKGLCSKAGRTSMIVPHSAICTDRMAEVQTTLFDDSTSWVSTYDIRPAQLFDGVDQRLLIYMNFMKMNGHTLFTSGYHRWHKNRRPNLLQYLEYVDSTSFFGFCNSVPKMQSLLETQMIEKLNLLAPLGASLSNRQGQKIYYHDAPRYWTRCTNFAPYFWNERDGKQLSNHVKTLKFKNNADAQVVVAALNSSVFYWWFILLSDCRDLNLREIKNFPIGLEQMSKSIKTRLVKVTTRLMANFKQNSRRKETKYKTTGRVIYDEFDQKQSKSIVDEIDHILAEHYGLTDEELDFIINYDIKYRMGLGE